MQKMRIMAFIVAAILATAAPASHIDPIGASELKSELGADGAPMVLDVRTEWEYESGHVPGAVHIPHTELAGRLSELSAVQKDEIVVYCEVGVRAAVAESILEEAGFTRVRTLAGHMRNWRAQGYPRE